MSRGIVGECAEAINQIMELLMTNPIVLNAKTLLPIGVVFGILLLVVTIVNDRSDAVHQIENNRTDIIEQGEVIEKQQVLLQQISDDVLLIKDKVLN